MIKYISDFDQLSWLINLEKHAFYEGELIWDKRYELAEWLTANCSSIVYIWNGLVSPVGSPKETDGWGALISPDGKTFFLIFLNSADEAAFVLHYGGSQILRTKHKNGIAAYHSRRGQ